MEFQTSATSLERDVFLREESGSSKVISHAPELTQFLIISPMASSGSLGHG